MIKEKQSVKTLLKTAFTLIFIYGVIFAVICCFYSYPLMNVLYYNHIIQSADVFRILMISIIPLSATYIFGYLLTANGNLKQLNVIAFLAIALNVGLNLLLIPHYYAIGSAIASIATQMFIIISEIVISISVFSLKLSGKYVIRLVGFSLFTVMTAWLSMKLPFSLAIDLGLMLCFCICLIFIFGLIKPKEVIALLKKPNSE
jgi:O-antigen/teichoic acid export membrane protein